MLKQFQERQKKKAEEAEAAKSTQTVDSIAGRERNLNSAFEASRDPHIAQSTQARVETYDPNKGLTEDEIIEASRIRVRNMLGSDE